MKVAKQQTGAYENKKSTNIVDAVLLLFNTLVMPLLTDAQRAITQRLVAACKRVQEIRAEQDSLSAAYERYVLLQRELRQQEKRMDRLAGLVGPEMFVDAALADKTDVIGDTVEVGRSVRQLRDELALWEAMQEYLAYAGEARIQDVQLFLESFGIEATREAIESAIRHHSETFKTRKYRGSKFVSLKGTEE